MRLLLKAVFVGVIPHDEDRMSETTPRDNRFHLGSATPSAPHGHNWQSVYSFSDSAGLVSRLRLSRWLVRKKKIGTAVVMRISSSRLSLPNFLQTIERFANPVVAAREAV
jgi:hypothetical protein